MILASHQLDLNISKDLKIINFGDASVVQYCYPQLTTIKQNVFKIVRKASDILLKKIKGNSPGKFNDLVNVKLINRQIV